MRLSGFSEAGNIFLGLFGAVAAAGVLGMALSGVMKGPLVSSVQLTRINTSENQMAQTAKSVVMAAASLPSLGDCDADGLVEPWEWRAPGSLPHPVGGGLVPDTIGLASKKDPWGTEYGYCVWDNGATILSVGCQSGGAHARLGGTNTKAAPAVAIISAGPDKVFSTTCRSFVDADNGAGAGNDLLGDASDLLMIDKAANADDIVFSYTYEEAAAASAGLWSLKPGEPNTAVIAKSLEVTGSVTSETGLFEKIGTNSLTTVPANCAGLGSVHYNDPLTGHCYFRASGAGWAVAKTNCEAQGAYLATITSGAEQAAIETILLSTGSTWIGGSSTASPGSGEWRWMAGPELNVQFWQGQSTGSSVGGMYNNWSNNEPSASNNNCIVLDSSLGQRWRAAGSCTSSVNYICEKSAMTAPGGALRIQNGVKLASPTEMPTCNAANKGSARQNAAETGLEICDGAAWQALGGEGGSGGGITFPLLAPNGTAAAPSYSFVGSPGSGLYRDNAGLKVKSTGTFEARAGTQVNMAGATNDFRIASAGGLKIGNDTGSCTTGIQGTLRYNSGTKKFEFCDGAAWAVFAGAPVPSGGGTGPQDCTGLGTAHYNDEVSGHCYYLNHTDQDWATAQASCQANGAYLVVISSVEEMLALDNLPMDESGSYNYWMGAKDDAIEGQWRWQGGELNNVHFWQEKPGGGGGASVPGQWSPWELDAGMGFPIDIPQGDATWGMEADCMGTSGILVDVPCIATNSYSICEKGM